MTSTFHTTPPPGSAGRPTLTARNPEDLLALVPVVLGFHPAHSVVMLTFGGRHTFHARVDAPGETDQWPDELEQLTAALLEPARRHQVRRVAFVAYIDDPVLGARTARHLVRAFTRAGIGVVDALRASGGRWYPGPGQRAGVPAWGVPYDVSAHPFVVGSVVDGRVTRGSREEVMAAVAADTEAVAAVQRLLDDAAETEVLDEPGIVALLELHVPAGTAPGDHQLAALLTALADPQLRDAVWRGVSRSNAREHAWFWSGVLRRSPTALAAAPAGVLAVLAWLAGEGALAWCAVDRCLEVDPQHHLAQLVAGCLTHAVPPSTWDDRQGLPGSAQQWPDPGPHA